MRATGLVVDIRAFTNYPKDGDNVRVTVGYELGSIGAIEFSVPLAEAKEWHIGQSVNIEIEPRTT